MSTMEMDPVFTGALREALKATVMDQSSGATSLALAHWNRRTPRCNPRGRGVAVASGLFSPPGAPVDTLLAVL